MCFSPILCRHEPNAAAGGKIREYYVCGRTGESRWAVEGQEEWMVGLDRVSGERFYENATTGEVRMELYATCWEEVRRLLVGEFDYHSGGLW
jgi:hypothetical protein